MSGNGSVSDDDHSATPSPDAATEARSVFSPAAYLADLLQLVDDRFEAAALTTTRRGIREIPLDAANTFTEVPYLDVVNEVLAENVEVKQGEDAYAALDRITALSSPVPLPFSLPDLRRRTYLKLAGVAAEQLYRQFTPDRDPDVVAREYLGLSRRLAELVTTPAATEQEVTAHYRFDGAGVTSLRSVDRFLATTGLTTPQLADLLFGRLSATAVDDGGRPERTRASEFFVNAGGTPVTVTADEDTLVWAEGGGAEPWRWFDRVHRFVRLARVAGLPFVDLDLVLRTLCANTLDHAAIRTVAVVRHLATTLDLPVDVVCSLVAPIDTLGIGDGDAPADLFDRTFNGRTAAIEEAVIRGSAFVPRPYRGFRPLTCPGDLFAPRNAAFRRRIVRALGIADADLAEIVHRFRAHYEALRETGPFDGDTTGPAALSLLHRVSRLAAALDLAPAELFPVLDALNADPSIRGHNTFDLLVDTPAGEPDCYRILADGTPADGLWLVQTLAAVVRWMQATDLTGEELGAILGGTAAPDTDVALLDELYQQFQPVLLAPEVFQSDRFDARSARVVHDVLLGGDGPVSARDPRVLRLGDQAVAVAAAYDCLVRLPVVEERDFVGLGLAEHVAQKIFANLVFRGYLDGDGLLPDDALPPTADGFALTGDFDAVRETVFRLLHVLCRDDEDAPAAPTLLPSDLEPLEGLSPAERAELYDNLVFNRYLDPDGTILWGEFFADPDNMDDFRADADLGPAGPAVWQWLRDRAREADAAPLALDPEIFADLRLPAGGVDRLRENLRVNGHLDAHGAYVDKRALLALDRDGLNLALEFYPHRRAILDAIQAQIDEHLVELRTMGPDDVADIADATLATRILAGLDGTYLTDRRVRDDQLVYFRDGGDALGLWLDLDPAAEAAICARIASVIVAQQPYHLDPAALADLDLDPDQVDLVIAVLTLGGDLTANLTLPAERVDYFADLHHALEYTVEGFEDVATDVFFLLHAVAQELSDGAAEIIDRLEEHAETQRHTVFTALSDGLGIPTDTVEAICRALCGDVDDVVDDLVVPVLAVGGGTGRVTAEPADPRFRALHRRLARFALLAAKLGLDGVQTEVAFRDQDLVGKFPERLTLPPGVSTVDALLPSADGHVYLFRGDTCWRYAASTYELEDRTGVPLGTLSAQLGGLARVEAAFVDATGAEWVVGRDRSGHSRTLRRERAAARWVATPRTWGVIRNNFTDPARIDTALRDADGTTYLFAGDQYVRYSGDDLGRVDEGYPRTIAGNWVAEGLSAALPPGVETSVDASFHGLDDRTYLFAGGSYVVSGETDARPVTERFGRVRNAFADAARVDAAYTDGSGVYVLLGDQIIRYSDCIENGGVRVDEGFPRRLEQHFTDLPAEFESGLEAAFAAPGNGVQLFKDGRTMSPAPGDRIVRRVDKRWGQLGTVLPSGTVDAAFVGLDGLTYLFSGARYVRYTGSDYSHVDPGFPRRVAADWAGMASVDAAFVLDGRTYLVGTPGRLFSIPVADVFARTAHEHRLDTGDVPPDLRERLLEHGLRTTAEGRVEGSSPEWTVPLEGGLRVVVRHEADALVVTVAPAVEPQQVTQFSVRYSGRSYDRPDAGYPRPLADDGWNLPESPVGGAGFDRVDAVFTGRDDRTYVFSGDRFAVFDNRHRWWSEPRSLRSDWDSIPFDGVDAALLGADGKTYVFGGPRYVRYSGDDYTRVDDRYPKAVTSFWGTVVNPITRSGHVDAVLVLRSPAEVAGGPEPLHTYLFSGRQYVRYTGTAYGEVDDGYPRDIATSLTREPRFTNLTVPLDGGIDAAVADQRSVYLFTGDRCHVVSTAPYRRYSHLGVTRADCAFLEDGAVTVREGTDWHRFSALEAEVVDRTPVRPRVLRAVPERFRTGADAVLDGVDGNTYLFAGRSCYDVRLGREYPTAEDWGRPRNTIADGQGVDAAFVGRDGKTYVFSGDQFVTYAAAPYAGVEVEGHPRSVPEHWGGLASVRLAYVRNGVTHLFEPPDADGFRRYVVYSGSDYTTPDPGYPQVAGPDFWGVPADRRGTGEFPVAVLFDRDNTLYLDGTQYVQFNSGSWSYPRPLTRLWPGVPLGSSSKAVRTAFTGADGATYLFSHDEFTRSADGGFPGPEPIGARWGLIRNNIASTTRAAAVDAAFVWRGTTTYLFSGDQYVRYSGADYRHVDEGYPKSVVDDLRDEECFAHLPEEFEQTLADRVAAGEQTVIDAVLANSRTVHLLVGPDLHAVSHELAATYALTGLGRVRNTLADTGRVDASFVRGEQTFLFSGDQYVRYTGPEYAFVDEGYPRSIAASLADDLQVGPIPDEFLDGLDAALTGPRDRVYLFRGQRFVDTGERPPTARRIAGTWGVVRNRFVENPYDDGIDAAFVDRSGALFAFKGDQFLRYATPAAERADDGYPRSIKDDWGDLPTTFEEGLDAAFVFEGATYLVRGDQYVRYSGDDLRHVDRTYPQPLARRWGHWADYQLGDLHVISRFKQLHDRTSDADGGLAAVLSASVVTADPYARIAGLFGWSVDELGWVKRHDAFLPTAAGYEVEVDLELVLAAVDLFALVAPLGAGPSTVYADVWTPLYGADGAETADAPDVPGLIDGRAAAAEGLRRLLALRHGEIAWPVVERTLHDELNEATRDALVAAVLAQSRTPLTSRDLFDRLFLDVEMGGAATTSRVREAIAAAQLFFHRYLLDLQPVTLRRGADGVPPRPDAVKAELRQWWEWMKNYRVWEANRKVYLYPENYLRPELRDTKTPAFAVLEEDLLQGELTHAAAERAYKRYLDEYTEVSRLTIAGGYVHEPADDDELPWHLVLFGRTKTDPRRYYYRRAEFSREASRSAQWHPWLKVGVQIDSDRVYPVFAFDRVFVFWATVEDVANSTPTVSFTDHTDGGTRSLTGGSQTTHVVRIYYSFYNLTREWVPAQALTTDLPIQESLPISDVRLLVARTQVPGAPGDPDRETIVVRCSYLVQLGPVTAARRSVAVALTPELYTEAATAVSVDETAADRFTDIFDEGVGRNGLPGIATSAAVPALPATAPGAPLAPAVIEAFVAAAASNATAALATVAGVGAAVATAATSSPESAPPAAPAVASTLAAAPVVVTFNRTSESSDGPWFSFDYKGGSFLCKPAPLPPVHDAYLPVSGDGERLPDWDRFQAAFTDPGGTSWFFDADGQYVQVDAGSAVPAPRAVAARFGRERNVLTENGVLDAAVTLNGAVYVFSGAQYFRYGGGTVTTPDAGYPKALESNTDGLPRWRRVDAAFTAPNGTAYFFSRDRGFSTSAAPNDATAVRDVWGKQEPPKDQGQGKDQGKDQGKGQGQDKDKTPPRPLPGFFDDHPVDSALVVEGRTYLIAGDQYVRYSGDYRYVDAGYPQRLSTNTEGLPRRTGVVVFPDAHSVYTVDNNAKTTTRTQGTTTETFPTGDLARGTFGLEGGIDAACVRGRQLFLTSGTRFVRYTLTGTTVPDLVDADYPKTCAVAVDALVDVGGRVFVFSDDRYGRLGTTQELDATIELKPIRGNWGNLPYRFQSGLDAAGSTAAALYLFRGDRYVRYPRTAPRGVPLALPYERTIARYEIVRLTTGTAVTLNRRLLAGGVAAVLDTATQETDETPAFDRTRSGATVIRVRPDRVDEAHLPVSSHLDFDSANGIYYWEAFFHAPLLIAQAFNAAQRFAEAKQWYEYVFDPTRARDSWRFLPFRSVDVEALVGTCLDAIAVLGGAPASLTTLLGRVRALAPVFTQEREVRSNEVDVLRADLPQLVAQLDPYVRSASDRARASTATADVVVAVRSLVEAQGIIARLQSRYDLMIGGIEAAVRRYLDDPFDPHAIAAMRPGAYRRAVVMAYIDNLLDWGDMLFRQYTGESIDEARMLYLHAYDLLGERPRHLGLRPMRDAAYYGQLRHEPGEYDMLLRWAAGVPDAAAPHASAAPPDNGAYFVVPENGQLGDYWTRVEDRLRKIRLSQDILGVSRPVPLFEPPIDPAALVAAVASGLDVAQAAASVAPVAVPHHRFAFLLRRAQDLVERLRGLGTDLLSVLERRDAEELTLLQSRHEGAILALTRAIKEEQVGIARANLAELAESETAARNRQAHYQRLLDQGMSPLEQAQIALMIGASIAHDTAAALKLASAIAHAFPQGLIGLFIAGVETGGEQAGSSIDKFSEFSESLGEGLSVTGEILGTFANQQRMAEDWQLQVAMAQSDVTQIVLRTQAATGQLAVAQRDLDITVAQIAQNDSVTTFLKGKFAGAQLYQWMSGQLSGLYLQAYGMAYDMARAAERAFQFECGVEETDARFVRPVYWDSRRGGLLAGDALGLDLERMATAYQDAGARGMEITKRISLAELDPVALLRLMGSGTCEFTLSEALFDYDFPGHYRRQVRWASVEFVDRFGEATTPNAVLTQLGHKTVLQPDPAAVRFLLDPKGDPPGTLRSDWRARQQVALSHVAEGEENNGLFRLNPDDDRYLPFEGTGAVSTWRLELTGRRSVDDPGGLGDVVLTLRYTAEVGNAVFAGAVKGLLKPYPTFRYLNVAAEFPDQWAEFQDGDGDELVLPISAAMFPNMVGRQITAIYSRFELSERTGVSLVLNGDADMTLEDGKVLAVNRLGVTRQGADWRLAVHGDKSALTNVNLALGYKADVQ